MNGEKEKAPGREQVKTRNIGGLYVEIKTIGLHEKIDLVNKAITLYQEADRLLDEANRISVVISLEDGFQRNGAESCSQSDR